MGGRGRLRARPALAAGQPCPARRTLSSPVPPSHGPSPQGRRESRGAPHPGTQRRAGPAGSRQWTAAGVADTREHQAGAPLAWHGQGSRSTHRRGVNA